MKKFDIESLKSAKAAIKAAKSVIITGHTNPDGDAMGACLALYNSLKKVTNAKVIMPSDYASFLKWMPGSDLIKVYSKGLDTFIANADVIFSLDYNELSRLGNMEVIVKQSKALKIMIDHHPYPDTYAQLNFNDETASSASELVYEFILSNFPETIDKDVAECIYTGMLTDTGSFSFNSSMPRTFEIVADLLKHGIDKNRVINNIYDNFSESRMRLMGYILNKKMKVFPEIHTGFITLTLAEQEMYNYQIGDSEGFVNMPLSIKGLRFSALFIENKDIVKCSFRSKGSFAVNEFSKKYFNGGGHKNAAGGKSFETLENTVQKFESLLTIYNNQLKNLV